MGHPIASFDVTDVDEFLWMAKRRNRFTLMGSTLLILGGTLR